MNVEIVYSLQDEESVSPISPQSWKRAEDSHPSALAIDSSWDSSQVGFRRTISQKSQQSTSSNKLAVPIDRIPSKRSMTSLMSNASRCVQETPCEATSGQETPRSLSHLEILSLRSPGSACSRHVPLLEQYNEMRILGEGAYGVVSEVADKGSRASFASKTVSLENEQAEVSILRLMKHENIVHLHEILRDPYQLHLILELCSGGDLESWVQENKQQNSFLVYTTPAPSVVARYAWQMLSAIVYIHAHEICHRDLKPDNFLFADAALFTLKLTDFSFACYFVKGEYMSKACGSLGYIAPEALSKHYTELCDVFSLGMVVHTIVVGRSYWPSTVKEEALKTLIKEANIMLEDKRWAHHVDCKLLVAQMLLKEQAGRPSAKVLIKDKWLRANGEQTFESKKEGQKKHYCVVS